MVLTIKYKWWDSSFECSRTEKYKTSVREREKETESWNYILTHFFLFFFYFFSYLNRRIMHPKFDPTGFRTHDFFILTEHLMPLRILRQTRPLETYVALLIETNPLYLWDSCIQNISGYKFLTPYWFKIIWDDTAFKLHFTQVTYVTRTSDWQQTSHMHDMWHLQHKSQHVTYIILHPLLLIKMRKSPN